MLRPKKVYIMPYNKLLECLKQKVILLTCISDLSRQIEKQCSLPNPGIEIAGLLQRRQIYIDRLKRCNSLIKKLLDDLSPDEQPRIRSAMSPGFQKEGCSETELELYNLEARCRSLLSHISSMDSESISRVQKERDHLKKMMDRSRRNNKNQPKRNRYPY